MLTRGSAWLAEAARAGHPHPTGHPEAFIEAFANVYLGVAAQIRALQSGITPLSRSKPTTRRWPTVPAACASSRRRCESARSEQKWTRMD